MTIVTNEFLINTTIAGSQLDATVTVLADGRFVVAWLDKSASANGSYPYDDIRYQIFHADGSKDGAERIANGEAPDGETPSKYYQSQPSISALADGGFVITYLDGRSSTTSPFVIRSELAVQRFDADGDKSGTDTTIMPHDDGNGFAVGAREPSVLGLSNGNYVVVNHTQNFPDGLALNDDTGIVMQIFNAAGTQILGWTTVNATTASLQTDAQITELSNGNFVVVWNSSSHSSGGWEVKAQVYTAAGVAVNGEITFPTDISVGQFTRPDVAALDNGNFVVTWVREATNDEFVNQGLVSDIVARIVDASGNLAGTEAIAVHARDALDQANPVVAATEDGTFLIVWQDAGESGSAKIQGQLFNSDGTKSGGLLTIGGVTNPDDTDPRITVTKDGRFFVVWEDDSRDLGGEPGDGLHGAFVDPRTEAVTFLGTSSGEEYVGTKFDDRLDGIGGNDHLSGGAGNDIIIGGAGGDVLDGGAGIHDVLSYASSTAVTVNLFTNVLSGGHAAGDEAIRFEDIIGSDGGDSLTGDTGGNVLKGGWGKDRLTGRDGNDTLDGQMDADTLTGGLGKDKLTGGNDADTFVFKTLADSVKGKKADTITDFASGIDTIKLTAIDAVEGGRDNAFSFIGSAEFSDKAGELRFEQDGGVTVISGDTDGDGLADFQIRLTGSIAPIEDDFGL